MMDLTSLSSTLPNNSNRQSSYPSAEMMSAFKQAALSVTTLYKQANTEIERSRKLGYQDCLDDLILLINSDRIQLNNEIVKLREWALSKRRKAGNDDDGAYRATGDSTVEESEDERTRPQQARSSSPMQADPSPTAPLAPQAPRSPSLPPAPQTSPVYNNNNNPPTPHSSQSTRSATKDFEGPFSFRSPARMPQPQQQPSQIPIIDDLDLPENPVDSLIATQIQEQPLHHYNNFVPGTHRAASGAWKRRFPHDFVALAAMAEREKMPFDYNNNKRGRLT